MYTYAADQLTNHGKLPYQVKHELESQDFLKEDAAKIVDSVYAQVGDVKDKKEKAKKDMMVGALWCLGCLAVTIFSYAAASGGGQYFMAWGAIIFGGIQFFKEVANYSS